MNNLLVATSKKEELVSKNICHGNKTQNAVFVSYSILYTERTLKVPNGREFGETK